MKKILLTLAILTTFIFSNDVESMKKIMNSINKNIDTANKTHNSDDQLKVSLDFGLLRMDKDAFQWAKKSADQGNANAQYLLAIKYRTGAGVKQDYAKALKLYTKSATQGNDLSLNELGVIYTQGTLVQRDYKKALEFFKKSAEQGNVGANLSIGNAYYFGRGTEKDKVKSYLYWTKAVKKGDKGAQENLDILCEESPWACK